MSLLLIFLIALFVGACGLAVSLRARQRQRRTRDEQVAREASTQAVQWAVEAVRGDQWSPPTHPTRS